MIEYLSPAQIERIHVRQIDVHGGAPGVRDRGAFESAVARPQMTFGGEDLYVDLAAKAAALMHSLVQNHPFLDGNERVGAAAMELFLLLNGTVLVASDDDLESSSLSTARGKLSAEAIAIWIRQRSRSMER